MKTTYSLVIYSIQSGTQYTSSYLPTTYFTDKHLKTYLCNNANYSYNSQCSIILYTNVQHTSQLSTLNEEKGLLGLKRVVDQISGITYHHGAIILLSHYQSQ